MAQSSISQAQRQLHIHLANVELWLQLKCFLKVSSAEGGGEGFQYSVGQEMWAERSMLRTPFTANYKGNIGG
jgi:hypothetical protein